MSAKAWVLLALLGLVFVTYDGLQIGIFLLSGDAVRTDFAGIWTFGRFPLLEHPADIYREAVFRQFQQEMIPGLNNFFPYPYPPYFLLLLAPIGAMDFLPARILWLLVTGLALLAATWALAGERPRWLVILSVIVAPLSLVNGLFGQTGFFTGALLCGGLALLPQRPVWAGILFGLLTCKPQLGILIPVALLAARAWPAIIAAAATTLVLAIASGVIFGWDMWPAWFATMTQHVGLMDGGKVLQTQMMPTVLITLLDRGLPSALAWAIQGAAFGAAIWAVWRCYRRDTGVASAAVLVAATFLATPYAFIYDMPAVSVTMIIMLLRQLRVDGRLPSAETAVVLVGQMAPAAMTWRSSSSIMLVLTLVLLVVLAMRRVPGQAAP